MRKEESNTPGFCSQAKKTGAGKRCGKSCGLREENFSGQEEELIINLHAAIGSRWAIIAQQIPGRTDSEVKNYWNAKLRKKLTQRGIDPVTHRPFSQILADYGRVGIFPNPPTSSLTRTCNNHSFKHQKQPTQTQTFQQKQLYTHHDSQDLFSELRAISNNSPSQDSPSSSSTTPVGFGWQDLFLGEEMFLVQGTGNDGFEDQVGSDHGEIDYRSHIEEEKCIAGIEKRDASFVEGILDQESDMFLGFPSILDEAFY